MVSEPTAILNMREKNVMRKMIFTLLVILGFCANASGQVWASEENSGLTVGYKTPESEKFNTPTVQITTVSFTKPAFNGLVCLPGNFKKETQRSCEAHDRGILKVASKHYYYCMNEGCRRWVDKTMNGRSCRTYPKGSLSYKACIGRKRELYSHCRGYCRDKFLEN